MPGNDALRALDQQESLRLLAMAPVGRAVCTALPAVLPGDYSAWRTVSTQRPESCGTDVVRLPGDEAVRYVRMQGVERRTTWGYSLYELGVYGTPGS
ncbi:hypothetical protein ACH4NV_29365 [Streptomyces althioticus]|uniref:hypothetical protein n=1 Tax=Streptomyces althioticus TaxID=83380 RepID=UPI0037A8CE04